MTQVIAPLIFADTKPEVRDLHNALIKLKFGGISMDERDKPFFGETTCKALLAFKKQFDIRSSACMVESQTAESINQKMVQKGSPLRVSFPLLFGMKSKEVLLLQEALTLAGFGGMLPAEKNVFGKLTCELVLKYQNEMNIKVIPCYVDDATADKMNALLDAPDVPDVPNVPGVPDVPNPPVEPGKNKYRISGIVSNKNEEPLEESGSSHLLTH